VYLGCQYFSWIVASPRLRTLTGKGRFGLSRRMGTWLSPADTILNRNTSISCKQQEISDNYIYTAIWQWEASSLCFTCCSFVKYELGILWHVPLSTYSCWVLHQWDFSSSEVQAGLGSSAVVEPVSLLLWLSLYLNTMDRRMKSQFFKTGQKYFPTSKTYGQSQLIVYKRSSVVRWEMLHLSTV